MTTRCGLLFSSFSVLLGVTVILAALPGCRRAPQSLALPGDIVELKMKDRTIRAEVASDYATQTVGLMERKSLCENCGMLFVYAAPEQLSFWMKNTYIPLSIAFLDDDGKILQIEDMQPKVELRTLSNTKVRYALEVNQGWFQRNGIGVGDAFADFAATVQRYHAK